MGAEQHHRNQLNQFSIILAENTAARVNNKETGVKTSAVVHYVWATVKLHGWKILHTNQCDQLDCQLLHNTTENRTFRQFQNHSNQTQNSTTATLTPLSVNKSITAGCVCFKTWGALLSCNQCTPMATKSQSKAHQKHLHKLLKQLWQHKFPTQHDNNMNDDVHVKEANKNKGINFTWHPSTKLRITRPFIDFQNTTVCLLLCVKAAHNRTIIWLGELCLNSTVCEVHLWL